MTAGWKKTLSYWIDARTKKELLCRRRIIIVDPTVIAPAGYVPRAAVSFGAPEAAAVAVDDAHPLPVVARAPGVAYTDRSGTLAAAATAQQVAPANPARRGFFVQNVSTADLWLSTVGAALADQPALRIAPGQLYECPAGGVPVAAISLYGTIQGQAFSAREW